MELAAHHSPRGLPRRIWTSNLSALLSSLLALAFCSAQAPSAAFPPSPGPAPTARPPSAARTPSAALPLVAAQTSTPQVAAPAVPSSPGPRWLATWVSAQQQTEPRNLPPAPGLANSTLRQKLQVTVGGSHFRVKFSNLTGATPLAIGTAHVALSTGDSRIDATTDKILRFSGNPTLTLAPGAELYSDPVEFAAPSLSNLAITLVIAGQVPESLTGHPGSRTTSYILPGNAVSSPELLGAKTTDHWYLLTEVDVWAAPISKAIAILGDSITDGRGSTTNGNDRWPNLLSHRLLTHPKTSQISVLNQGIGGNRVLLDGLGPSLVSRIERDAFLPPGVRWVILFAGVNDLGTAAGAAKNGETPATAARLIAAYQGIVDRAHQRNLLIYGATITPIGNSFYYTPEAEKIRQKVNAWIREPGHFDAVIDFDALARDPNNPANLSAAVDGGDHLHPSAMGYRIMANGIDLGLFQ